VKLKVSFHVIRKKFVGLVNDSLRKGQCLESWQ